jgi:amino acid transporter
MSEASAVPFSETKAPEAAPRLRRGALSLVDISPLTFFVESSTMGTILILVVYFLANLALPFYYRRYRPTEFNVFKHVVLPALGMVAIGVPMYYLVKPGQPPPPADWFPYAALAIVVLAGFTATCSTAGTPGSRTASAASSPTSDQL